LPVPVPFGTSDAPESLSPFDWDRGKDTRVAQHPSVEPGLDLDDVNELDETDRAPSRQTAMLTESWAVAGRDDQEIPSVLGAPRAILDVLPALGDLTRVGLPNGEGHHLDHRSS